MSKEKILIKPTKYIYRSEHLTMEGTCSVDHGPREVEIKQIWVDKYPVTNNDTINLLKKQDINLLKIKLFSKIGKIIHSTVSLIIILSFGSLKKMLKHMQSGLVVDFLLMRNGNT